MTTVLEPATEAILGEVAPAGIEQVDEAVARAKRAYPGWRIVDPHERARVLHRLADALSERREALATLEARNVGKPISGALAEIGMVVGPHALDYYTELKNVYFPTEER